MMMQPEITQWCKSYGDHEFEEKVIIHQLLPADDWWVLFKWPEDEGGLTEIPVIGFAHYTVHFQHIEQDGIGLYSGIAPVVQSWVDGDIGRKICVLTTNAYSYQGAVSLYKGRGQYEHLLDIADHL